MPAVLFLDANAPMCAARAVMAAHVGLSARDAAHVAVMRRAGVHRLLSFDAGFDRVPGLERLR